MEPTEWFHMHYSEASFAIQNLHMLKMALSSKQL